MSESEEVQNESEALLELEKAQEGAGQLENIIPPDAAEAAKGEGDGEGSVDEKETTKSAEATEEKEELSPEDEEMKRLAAAKREKDEAAMHDLRKEQTAGVSDMVYVRPPTKFPPPVDCLDSFLRMIGLRRPEPERSPILTTANEVANCREAMERVSYALSYNPPGTVLRWDKLLTVCNRTIEPSEEDPDPLRIGMEMEEFKLVLRTMYQRAKTSANDGISLMREYLPKMYDKHSLERGKRVSQVRFKDKR